MPQGLPLAARAELLHVLRLPDLDRAERVGGFWGHPETRGFGELLIDLEEDKAARAVVFGLLAEMKGNQSAPHGERGWLSEAANREQRRGRNTTVVP